MVKLKDIAKEAGVSIATVSQVLNNKESSLIGKTTRETVTRVAERLSYTPNRVARDLARGSTMILGVIIPLAANSFFPEVVEGVEDVAFTKGYDIILSYSAGCPEKEQRHIQSLLERKADGLLIAPLGNNRNISIFKGLLKQKFPFVFIDRYISELDTEFVVSNLTEGAYEAVSYLIGEGHTKIAHITEKADVSTVRDVLSGYKEALTKNNLGIDQNLIEVVETASDGHASGYDGMRELLKRKVNPTALLCIDDNFAIGAIKALKEHKLKIPEDISVIGMDDLSVSSYLVPSLSSVAQNRVQMGKIASEILIERIKNRESRKRQVFLSTDLILKESTGIIKKVVAGKQAKERNFV